MISFDSKGDFKNTNRFLKAMTKNLALSALSEGARQGVIALASASPMDSGLTAASWGYEIAVSGSSYTITWINSNSNNGVNIAIILQLGHGTGTGGWVSGRDYINPAIQPIFDQIAEDVWKAVYNA